MLWWRGNTVLVKDFYCSSTGAQANSVAKNSNSDTVELEFAPVLKDRQYWKTELGPNTVLVIVVRGGGRYYRGFREHLLRRTQFGTLQIFAGEADFSFLETRDSILKILSTPCILSSLIEPL